MEFAEEVSKNMANYVVRKITDTLNTHKKCINDSKILVLGVAQEENVGDMRKSPALGIIEILNRQGAEIICNDPYIPQIKIGERRWKSLSLNENLLSQADCIVITTAHSSYDYKWIVENAKLIVDTRNATENLRNKEKIARI